MKTNRMMALLGGLAACVALSGCNESRTHVTSRDDARPVERHSSAEPAATYTATERSSERGNTVERAPNRQVRESSESRDDRASDRQVTRSPDRKDMRNSGRQDVESYAVSLDDNMASPIEQREAVTLRMDSPPPHSPPEFAPEDLPPNQFWVPGEWRAESGKYVWHAGHVETRRRGELYHPAKWAVSAGKWEYTPDYWQ